MLRGTMQLSVDLYNEVVAEAVMNGGKRKPPASSAPVAQLKGLARTSMESEE